MLGVVVAAVEGLALVANGFAVAWVVVADGLTGPAEVASPVGVALEVALYLLFGAAMLWIARGLARGSGAVLTPFLLAQLLGLTVAVPLASSEGAAGIAGWAFTIGCLLGLVAWWTLMRTKLADGDGGQ